MMSMVLAIGFYLERGSTFDRQPPQHPGPPSDWLQTPYGHKIKQAVEYRDKYSRPHIISEEHWTRDVIG